jgi:hypothetical protein
MTTYYTETSWIHRERQCPVLSNGWIEQKKASIIISGQAEHPITAATPCPEAERVLLLTQTVTKRRQLLETNLLDNHHQQNTTVALVKL